MKLFSFLGALMASATLAVASPVIPAEYPLKTCPISGEALGSGGMVPYKVTHKGTDVWLCCKMCEKRFNQNPEKHAGKVKAAANAKE